MRFELLYALGSLWNGVPGPQVCPRAPVASSGRPAAATPSPMPGVSATAFVDVNVVPMDAERVLAHYTVVVQDGQVIALGPVSRTRVPAGAVRVDGRGKYLMPGLTDMHVHLHAYALTDDSEETLRRKLFSYLTQGITGVRDFGSGKRWMSFRTPGSLAPRLYVSPSLAGIRTVSLDSVAAYVAAFKTDGYDFIQLSAGYRTSTNKDLVARYDSVATAARRLGLTVASHTNGESFEELLAFGAYGGSVEHLHYAFKDLLGPRETAVSNEELRARAAAVRRAGAWISLTQDCIENRKRGNGEVGRRLVKALHDAGVGLLLGVDAENRAPAHVHVELANLILAGLTPYQALATGTRNVAAYFGTLDSAGTVAAGRRADLLLLSGNPLTDVRYLREPAGVMIAGRWLDRTTLDQGLVASPTLWLRSMQAGFPNTQGVRLPRSAERGKSEEALRILADSLEATGASSRTDGSHERLLRRFTDELGVLSPLLIPAERDSFEPMARVWMREHARQGRRLIIPGVVLTP
jgi:imidazolonepropionase-like amidohydrolase